MTKRVCLTTMIFTDTMPTRTAPAPLPTVEDPAEMVAAANSAIPDDLASTKALMSGWKPSLVGGRDR